MEQIKKQAEKYFNNSILTLQKWININSIYDATTVSEGAPFGKGVKEALQFIGNLAKNDGFDVDFCDGYCTEISFGKGPLIAIYAHADVVPVSGEWRFDPFSGHIEDGIMYGRGTSDDKGPAVAAYYAIKTLRDLNLIDNYRVTLVIGGNEESGSRCLEYYFNELHKPYPEYGFTPDGDFPLIYGEKAIASYTVQLEKNFELIKSIKGGVVINSVIDRAIAELNQLPELNLINDYCNKYGLSYEINGNILTFIGKAAHGSLPKLGINAGVHMIHFLGQVFNYSELEQTGFNYLDGEGANMSLRYESELLHETTYNIGLLSYENGVLTYHVNFRYPEIVNPNDIIEKLNQLNLGNAKLNGASEYLLMDPKSPMIMSLLECYQEETGDYVSKPMAIGGGTYAKESRNTVAFGSHFPGREDHIHEANEKIHLEDLTKSISIYANAIYKLGKLTEK